MKRMFIASHGRFASGLLSSIEVLIGRQDAVTAYDAYLDETTVADAVEAFYQGVGPDDQVFLLSDLYGGSVNTELCKFLDRPATALISGVNLAMALALCVEPAPVSPRKLQEILGQARDQINVVQLTAEPVDEDFF